jgi:putative transposase
MKKSRFTEEQIAFALRQAETGTAAVEVIRKMGVSEQTFYRWKKQYAEMGVGELRRMKQLEEENRKLKQLIADLSLDKAMLQDVISSKLQDLVVAASSSVTCRIGIGSASAAAVRSCGLIARATAIDPTATTRRFSGTASGRSQPRVSATDIAGSTLPCAGRG